MIQDINVVVLTGRVERLKIKYTTGGKSFVSFTLVQPNFGFVDNEVVGVKANSYQCNCFEASEWLHGRIKIGGYVTVSGELVPYFTRYGKTSITILVKRIVVHRKEPEGVHDDILDDTD